MENFIAFLRDNWKFLVEISIPLVSLIVLCFVKKTKINIPESVQTILCEQIPLWIIDAEAEFGAGNGEKKLKAVFTKAIGYLVSQLGLSSEQVIKVYGDFIVDFIEDVLSTPSKKEVNE